MTQKENHGEKSAVTLAELVEQNKRLRDRLEQLIADSQHINEEYFRIQKLLAELQARQKALSDPTAKD